MPMQLSHNELINFTVKLSTWDFQKLTTLDLRMISDFIGSDGCSAVPDFYLEACVVHDWYYATHRDFDGTPISFEEANRRFRDLIQKKSKFGVLSPMSWWRFWAVTLFARKAWND